MARTLTLKFKGNEIPTSPEKVDKKKLYGWNETLALDDDGNECRLASMDESGTVIIPPKGTSMGIMAEDGKWVEKSDLVAVNPDGTPATMIPSSYSVPIELNEIVSIEEYLDHTITAFYQLSDIPTELMEELKNNIYAFDYTYLNSYNASKAFLMATDGAAFMLIGAKGNIEMLSLDETAVVNEEEEDEEDEEDSDALDFSMF